MIYFRSLTLAYFEIYFNRTIEYNEETRKWVVVMTNGKLIKDRFIQSERLTLFLNPEWHTMTFFPLIHRLENAIDVLQTESDSVAETEERIEFLKGLIALVTDFRDTEKPREAAMKDFKRLVIDQCEKSKKFIGVLIDSSFTTNINMDLLKDYKSKCFSGLMTLKDCIAFWSDEKSLLSDGIGEIQVVQIRSLICRFLLMEKNQSSEERSFAYMKKRMTGRPKLNPVTLCHEHQIKQICLYPDIFEKLQYDDEEAKSIVKKFTELESIYEKYSKQIEKEIEGEINEHDVGKLPDDEISDEETDEVQRYFKDILRDREACLSDDDESDSDSESDSGEDSDSETKNEMDNK